MVSTSEDHRGIGPDHPVQQRGRDETAEERADRMWDDLLHEVRVAWAGAPILFGVLLVAAFQYVFADLDRAIHVAAVTFGAAGAGALIGPVSPHRIVAGHRIKPRTVMLAARMTECGLVLLAATTVLALLLLLRTALDDTLAAWLTAAFGAWLLAVSLVLPVWARHHYASRR
ncbi:DUF6328 family protein [Streptomyces sp. NPDC017095]|uniref:DUF6328 family protein n=1 Tax=Streptomyces sp. NPDC017095 TaxID=3364977 RepID=UPI0037B0DF00